MPVEKDKVKGIEIATLIRNVKKRFGDDGFSTILSQLKEEEREILIGIISPTKWYEIEFQAHLLSAIHAVYGGSDYSLIHEFGRQSAEAMFNGVFRIFLPFINPRSLLQQAARFWRQVHTTGALVVVESKEGYAKGMIVDCFIPSKVYCLFTLAYFQRFFELCGAKNVIVKETKCFCQGDEYCEYEVTWT